MESNQEPTPSPADWEELRAIAAQSNNHHTVAFYVDGETESVAADRRMTFLITVASYSLSRLLQEEDPYYLGTIATITSVVATTRGLLNILAAVANRSLLKKLLHEHPARLKMILKEIREKIVVLAPIVDRVEQELFHNSKNT